MTPKIIKVTEKNIWMTPPDGVEGDNPVMLAIREGNLLETGSTRMNGVAEVVVNVDNPDSLPYLIALPLQAQKLVRDFYAGKAVAPIRFECEPVYHAALIERRRDDWLDQWLEEIRVRGWRIKSVSKHRDWFIGRLECRACKLSHSTHEVRITRDYTTRILDDLGDERRGRYSATRSVWLCEPVMGAFLGILNRESERRRIAERNGGGWLSAAIGNCRSVLEQSSRSLQAQFRG